MEDKDHRIRIPKHSRFIRKYHC